VTGDTPDRRQRVDGISVRGDARLGGEVQGREGGDDLLGFEGDGDDLADEAEDVAIVVGAVGVVDYAGTGNGGDSVLCWSLMGTHSRAERLPRR
jgi:hypothetical protein